MHDLNAVPGEALRDRWITAVDDILISIFSREPLVAQPRYIVDLAGGDNMLLEHLYATVRDRTARGSALRDHPLTLIDFDSNTATQEKIPRALGQSDRIVLSGAGADPLQIEDQLRSAGLEPRSVLYVDSSIAAASVAPNRLDRLQRWALTASDHGLLVVDRLYPAQPSMHDKSQGRESHSSAADLAMMAAAEAGFFPRAEFFRRFPVDAPMGCITVNLYERQAYRARPAKISDIPALLRLEDACWPDGMRMPATELERRIIKYSQGQWVLELDGVVSGVIYSQRISAVDQLRNRTYPELAALHLESGPVVQLLALNVFPEMQHLGLGYQLLDLILMRSALQDGVSKVAALTRCRDFHGDSLEALGAYVGRRDDAGRPIDPILNFHHSHGASILGLAPGFRPEDTANLGAGVLVCYDMDAFGTAARPSVAPGVIAADRSGGQDTAARLESCLRRLPSRQRATEFSWNLPLRELGFDSLDMLALRTQLEQTFERSLSPTFFFSHPTLGDMRRFFDRSVVDRDAAGAPELPSFATAGNANSASTAIRVHGPAVRADGDFRGIAVIGMACRFPGCADLDAYWDLLARGGDAITEVPPQRWDATSIFSTERDKPGTIVSRDGGFLANVDEFDASFFNVSPREARLMDPQQRLLLETHWESLEHAGIDPGQLRDAECGIFVGLSSHDYEVLQIEAGADEDLDGHYATGNSAAIAAGRLAYFLGTRGPALTLDTACSSSLVAVHQAIRSLRSGECDLALASGANLILSPRLSMAYSRAGMLSPRGRCRTFDAGADGYVRAEGCGVVVLKRLEDAKRDGDVILALLRGSAVNQDGASNGLTAPNLTAQEELLRAALRDAQLQPADIDFIEAHGTGTSLGDPVEFHSLQGVFGADSRRSEPLWLGSVKTNIGHTEAAAGIAGLIKVVLSMQRHRLPAHLHFETVNPHIELANVPARIPHDGHLWERSDRPLRAGINSFGISGTNAHVIVEEASAPDLPQAATSGTPTHILPLSAKSHAALESLAGRYLHWIDANPQADLGNMCHTAGAGRAHHDHRLAIVANSQEEFAHRLNEASGRIPTVRRVEAPPRIAFLFTGQGSQYVGMARDLSLREPAFRMAMQECSVILRSEMQRPLEEILYSGSAGDSALDDTANTQPALFAVEYSLARMLEAWGIQPSALMGHSVGEYVAACIAGVFSLQDGLKLIAARGRLMSALPRDGAMLAVLGRSPLVAQALHEDRAELSVAAYNGPENTVISGRRRKIERLEGRLVQAGVRCVQLQVSHAFHSPLMEPMLGAFSEIAGRVRFFSPRLEFISNVTGEGASAEITSAEYWCRHIREPVRFDQGIKSLLAGGARLMLEVGPHPVLSGMARKCAGDQDKVKWLHTLERGISDWESITRAVGTLYESGTNIDWSRFDAAFSRRRIDLPTYPWQRQRFWFKRKDKPVNPASMPWVTNHGHDTHVPGDSAPDATGMLFDLVWQPRSRSSHVLGKPAPDYLPSLLDLQNQLQQESSRRLGESTHSQSAVAALDALAVNYVIKALTSLGWEFDIGARIQAPNLMTTLGIAAAHHRLFIRMLAILTEAQLLEMDSAGWKVVRSVGPDDLVTSAAEMQARLPHHAVELRLFDRCAGRLAEVLTNQCDPLQLLFPQDSEDSVGRLYDNSAMSGVPNALMKQLVTAVAASVPSNRVLRVLEIGAGTGGTTSHLLPLLESISNEYVFTDVSKLFLARAAEKYRNHAGIQFALLDIEQSPAAQGMASGQFDLVIAANVLHATRDMRITLNHIRSLLAPGGMLALVEGIRPARWIDLVFGQTEGWWRFSDLELRPAHPLLSVEKWHQVLRAGGFGEIATVPTQNQDHPNVFEQAIIMARAPVESDVAHLGAAGLVAGAAGTWLIVGEASPLRLELTRKLESGGNHVVRIATEENAVAKSVASALASADPPCKYVICMPGVSTAMKVNSGVAPAYSGMISCFTDALQVTQSVVRSTSGVRPRIWFVTRGTQPAGGAAPDAGAATLWGLGRVLASEHPEAYGGLIDLDKDGTTAADIDAILAQVLDSGGADQCAIRSGVRFVPQLIPARAAAETAIQWPTDGCHIVTGGLSGVGLHLAQWLAQQGARRLVLMSRRGLPPRSDWERVGPNEALHEPLSRIREMERLGVAVRPVAVDVSDEAALLETLQSLNADGWLPVRGVIHAATASADGLITNLDSDGVRKSFDAKVLGSLTLESCLADQPLRFFVYCSSLTSLLAQEGQANYAAANAFIDAHVIKRRRDGHPALGVNWGSWYGTGAADTIGGGRTVQSLEERGFRGFLPQEGVDALAALLRRNATQAAVMRMDWAAFQENFRSGAVPGLLERLAVTATARPTDQAGRRKADSTPATGNRAFDRGNPEPNALERHLKETLADVLGLEATTIDSTVTMGSLGLDSLMGVEFRNRCERSLGVRLSATLVWNYPTIVELTRHLTDKLAPGTIPSEESRNQAVHAAASVPGSAGVVPVFGDVREMSEEAALQALFAAGAG